VLDGIMLPVFHWAAFNRYFHILVTMMIAILCWAW